MGPQFPPFCCPRACNQTAMKLCTLLLAALLAAAAMTAQAQTAPVAAAGSAPPTPKARIISMIDGGLHGYNASTVATATCLVAVRGVGAGSAASDAVGTAVAGLLKTEAPVISWDQDGAVHAALVFFNFTSASPLGDARAACRTVQAGLPAKLRRGASVTTGTFTYLFDPRVPAKKGACTWLCNRFCRNNVCRRLCNWAGRGCRGVCTAVGAPWFVCMWL